VTVGAGMAFKAVPRQPPLVPPPAPPPPAPALPEHARLSFSQQGEDIVLFHTLRDLLKIDPDFKVSTFLERSPSAPFQLGRAVARALQGSGIPP